jgi:hypothetical protein
MYGLGLFALSLSHYLFLSLVIALAFSFSLMMMASSNTILQTIVDDKKRGRVISLFVMAPRRGIVWQFTGRRGCTQIRHSGTLL